MKARLKWAAAIIGCICVVNLAFVHAEQPQNPFTPVNAAGMPEASCASYDTFENCSDCDFGGIGCEGGSGCEEGCLGKCDGILNRSGQFFIGADYLNVRSTFSESTAYVVTTGTQPGSGSTLLPPVTNVYHELDYGYGSSYRIFGGYRLCECGEEIRFAFTRFNNDASALSPAAFTAAGGNQTTRILGPYELIATTTGDRISVNSSVDAKIYDLDFSKTIPLGSPACGGCDSCDSGCDTGCDSCCDWCPAWDIKWTAGIRFAQVDWDRRSDLQSTDDYRTTTMDFDGGGARVGMEGTRYFGRRQNCSLFAKGDMSLLLGEVSIEHISGIGGGSPSIGTLTQYSSTQLIPVLDIEAGGTIYLADRLTISAGYLFSAWFDLGMRDTFDVLQGNGPISFDDSNILGFDGLFARAEFTY